MIIVPVVKVFYFTLLGHEFRIALFFLTALIAFFVFLGFYLFEAKRKKLNMKEVVISFLIAYAGVIIGSRFFYYFMPWWSYHRDWSIWRRLYLFANPNEPGMVFYGGLFGAVLFVWIYLKLRKLNFWKYMDAMAPGFALSLAIARVGCFLTDDTCRGVASNLPWAVLRIKEGIVKHDGAIHPAPVYSIINLLVLFGILWYLRKKGKFDGWLALIGLMYYSVTRFLIEFIRYYPIKLGGVITPSHVVSVILFFLLLWVFFEKKKKAGKWKKTKSS